jgi:hypothetical protein
MYLTQTQDDFGKPICHTPGTIIYDAKTQYGSWATMSSESWKAHGIGKLGLGLGQAYIKTVTPYLWEKTND